MQTAEHLSSQLLDRELLISMKAEPAEAEKPEHLETNVLLLGDTVS